MRKQAKIAAHREGVRQKIWNICRSSDELKSTLWKGPSIEGQVGTWSGVVFFDEPAESAKLQLMREGE